MGKLVKKVRAAVRKSPLQKPVQKLKEKVTRNGRAAKPATPPPEGARVDFATLSLKDALDLAVLVEKEAEERYQKLSGMVGGRYAGDAGDVFREMARNEARHCAELEGRRRELFGDAPRAVSLDALDGVEAPDWTEVRVFMSARQAMELAAADERKAHDFYDRASLHTKDAAVRKLFEDLRAEESRHEETLRRKMKDLPTGPDVDTELADEPGSDPG